MDFKETPVSADIFVKLLGNILFLAFIFKVPILLKLVPVRLILAFPVLIVGLLILAILKPLGCIESPCVNIGKPRP